MTTSEYLKLVICNCTEKLSNTIKIIQINKKNQTIYLSQIDEANAQLLF